METRELLLSTLWISIISLVISVIIAGGSILTVFLTALSPQCLTNPSQCTPIGQYGIVVIAIIFLIAILLYLIILFFLIKHFYKIRRWWVVAKIWVAYIFLSAIIGAILGTVAQNLLIGFIGSYLALLGSYWIIVGNRSQ